MIATGAIARVVQGPHDLVNWAVHHDDPDRLELLLNHKGWSLFGGWGAFPHLLIGCGPRVSRLVADWAPHQPDPTGMLAHRILGTMSSRLSHRPGGQRLVLAAHAACGAAVRDFSAPEWAPEHRLLMRLRSAHGRLGLMARFPDLLSVLLADVAEIGGATGYADG